eukprot:symbB.v1.2.008504.t1/scaffold527.1/size293072/2
MPRFCLFTEWMPAGSLHHLLHKVCEGIQFLHGRSPPVVHQDLKSLNIVLNNDYSCKLCDFGSSLSMATIDLDAVGLAGSPRYLSLTCGQPDAFLCNASEEHYHIMNVRPSSRLRQRCPGQHFTFGEAAARHPDSPSLRCASHSGRLL